MQVYTLGGAENKTAQKFCQHYNSSDNLYNDSDKHYNSSDYLYNSSDKHYISSDNLFNSSDTHYNNSDNLYNSSDKHYCSSEFCILFQIIFMIVQQINIIIVQIIFI